MKNKQASAVKKTVKPTTQKKATHDVSDLFKKNNLGIRLDIGCGGNKQPGFVGMDFRKEHGVDIVQDLTLFPWKQIPDESVSLAMASHLLEHINPASPDPKIGALIDLLISKKILTEKEVQETVGDYRFLGGFIRFMDEVWRITKPGGQFMAVFPYAGSPGYWQDPTHINPINQTTLAYFDPLARDEATGQLYHLYTIYRPMPWKIQSCSYNMSGFIEVVFEKRAIDPSYRVSKNNGMGA